MRRSGICPAGRGISGSDMRRSDTAWKREVMSFIADSCATWIRIGWLAAAATASAWARTISIPLQPRHSPLRPQWQSWGRRRSSAAWRSERSMGPAMFVSLRVLLFPRVHRFDLVAVGVRHHLPLDVQLQRQLARLLCEVVRQQREVLDRLPLAELAVDAVDRPLDLCPQRGLIE